MIKNNHSTASVVCIYLHIFFLFSCCLPYMVDIPKKVEPWPLCLAGPRLGLITTQNEFVTTNAVLDRTGLTGSVSSSVQYFP